MREEKTTRHIQQALSAPEGGAFDRCRQGALSLTRKYTGYARGAGCRPNIRCS
jgi:hypothetical protein